MVLYRSQGAAWAAPLVRLKPEELAAIHAAAEAAERALAMNTGKQVAVAMLQYAADSGEQFPTTEGLSGALGPYLPDSAMLDNFNYTLGGGRLADIQKPAETELGWIPQGGGRAVIYVDGHVVWKKE
jgi:hypothetical protein